MSAVIGIDWGTTNGRAYILEDGDVIDRRNLEQGALLPAGTHETLLQRALGDWLETHPNAPIILCGMVGAREGWFEAGYLECPVREIALSDHTTNVSLQGRRAHIIPGLKHAIDADVGCDVMRGEEVQIFGALSQSAAAESVICLPGTHSKWARADRAAISSFKTYMTGDVFAAVCQGTILSKSMGRQNAELGDAFTRGVLQARKGGTLLSDLFTTRTRLLAGLASTNDQASYISGLTIGHEVRDAITRNGDAKITLIGDPKLTSFYCHALEVFERSSMELNGEACVGRGLWAIAQSIHGE